MITRTTALPAPAPMSPPQAPIAAAWRAHFPARLGDLPLGGDLVRTDPAGPADARVAILGVYPAATAWKHYEAKRGAAKLIKLPVAVERTSFEPASRSGGLLDKEYLDALGLSRDDVLLLDLWPYFMANTRRESGRRSMAENVREYEKATGHRTAVEARPVADELLARVRTAQGSLERLGETLGAPSLRLVLTLGNEPAAFAHGIERAADAQPHLYADPAEVRIAALGRSVTMIHLTHPGNGKPEWRERHSTWCATKGKSLVAAVLAG